MSIPLHPMKMVCVTTEALARPAVEQLLAECGCHGFTIIAAEGAGSQGQRLNEIPETSNILVKAILKPSKAEALIARLWQDFMPRFAMVVWEEDIRVLRPDKF